MRVGTLYCLSLNILHVKNKVMNWNEILTATGILSSFQIIIVLLVGYFFKMRFENKLDKSIESHKKELQKN